ncbi:MAG TPA: hypothetical protein VII68_11985, partial [Casimicrobiaceae bacterium]
MISRFGDVGAIVPVPDPPKDQEDRRVDVDASVARRGARTAIRPGEIRPGEASVHGHADVDEDAAHGPARSIGLPVVAVTEARKASASAGRRNTIQSAWANAPALRSDANS